MERIKIRKFRKGDEKPLSKVVRKILREFNSKQYSRDLIEDLCNQYDEDFFLTNSNRDYIAILEEGQKMIGTGRLEEDFVKDIFVIPKYHGKGLGRSIVQRLEKEAKKKKTAKLKVPAGKYITGFYEKLGYSLSRDKLNSKTSVLMEKKL